jgi:hypothetical protein
MPLAAKPAPDSVRPAMVTFEDPVFETVTVWVAALPIGVLPKATLEVLTLSGDEPDGCEVPGVSPRTPIPMRRARTEWPVLSENLNMPE